MYKKRYNPYTKSGDAIATHTVHHNLLWGVRPTNNSEPLTYVPKLLRILHQAGRHKTNRKPSLAAI